MTGGLPKRQEEVHRKNREAQGTRRTCVGSGGSDTKVTGNLQKQVWQRGSGTLRLWVSTKEKGTETQRCSRGAGECCSSGQHCLIHPVWG